MEMDNDESMSQLRITLIYLIVIKVRYVKEDMDQHFQDSFKEIFLDFEERFDFHLIEAGFDEENIYFLIQSVPEISVEKMYRRIQKIMIKQLNKISPGKTIFQLFNKYYVQTIGSDAYNDAIQKHVQEHGRNYQQIFKNQVGISEELTRLPWEL